MALENMYPDFIRPSYIPLKFAETLHNIFKEASKKGKCESNLSLLLQCKSYQIKV